MEQLGKCLEVTYYKMATLFNVQTICMVSILFKQVYKQALKELRTK